MSPKTKEGASTSANLDTSGTTTPASNEVLKNVSAVPTTTPKAESILKSLLENIKNGKSPTKEQLGLYTALQSLQEGADKTAALALIQKQLGEVEAKQMDKNDAIKSILAETLQAMDSVKKNAETKISGELGPVVSQIFGYTGDFKETTDYDEFLDMLRATVKLAKSGKSAADAEKLTASDWNAAGHDGQYLFDDAELQEANAFYAHVLKGNLMVRAEQLTSAKTGRDLMVALLKVTDAKYIATRANKGATYKDSEDTKVTGKRKIEEEAGKTDAIDVLFATEAAPWSIPMVRSILQGLPGSEKTISNQRIETVYATVTGEKLSIDELAKNPEKAMNFQRMLIEKMNFLTEIAKLNLQIKAPDKKITGITGLTAILSGKFDEVANQKIAHLQANIAKLPPGSPEVATQTLANMAGRIGLPIAAALLSGGVAIASYENREVTNSATFNDIATRYDADKPLGALMHNIFLGKEYSLRFGENHAIKAYVESVRAQMDTFKAIAEFGFTDSDITKLAPEDQPMYRAVQGQYKMLINNKISPEAAK